MTEFEEINDYIKVSLSYKEKNDFKTALRYASVASVISLYPRADVCCIIGDLYLKLDVLTWAKFWFERAVGNMYLGIEGERIDEASYTWLPMLKLAYILSKKGNYKEAYEMNESVLKIVPDNEDALENKKTLSEMLS